MGSSTAAPDPSGAGRWDPWQALRVRSHVTFALDPVADLLGGGFLARRGDRSAIVLAPGLGRRQRRCALAHELVHDERGGGCDHPHGPTSWDAVAAREEGRVDDEVARRLVPAAELRAYLARRTSLGEAPEAWEVAEEFDVDDRTARRALALLAAAA